MDDIRQLPEQTPRVETGSVRFGGDWPGVFIRGDNAAYYAASLSVVLRDMVSHDGSFDARMAIRATEDLVRHIYACLQFPHTGP
jgi:hypothetical protein